MAEIKLFCADVTGMESNCSYPNEAVISDAESLRRAVGRDYVPVRFRNNYRSTANFIEAECLCKDCDNDHSDNPEDWITPEFMQFTDDTHCRSSERLLRGDLLVTRTKGHTVVVLSDGAKAAEERQSMPAEYALGDRLLKNGSLGADVKQLQEALIRLGISCGDYGADGEFGDCTEMAVIAYQKQHALEPDGEYGPLTHASLTAELERLDNPAQQNCVRIVGGNCYVRVQPNTDAEKLGVAHRDTLLPYQGETAANGWLKVSFAGRDGWVSGKYGRICG